MCSSGEFIGKFYASRLKNQILALTLFPQCDPLSKFEVSPKAVQTPARLTQNPTSYMQEIAICELEKLTLLSITQN